LRPFLGRRHVTWLCRGHMRMVMPIS
jgi:hypothetical protein